MKKENVRINLNKIKSIIKQDSAEAFVRMMSEPSILDMVVNNAEYMRMMWMSGSWKCLEYCINKCCIKDEVLLFDGVKTPELVLLYLPKADDKKLKNYAQKDDSIPELIERVFGIYYRVCHAAEKEGWMPDANWGVWIGILHAVKSGSAFQEWLNKIPPSSKTVGYGQWAVTLLSIREDWAQVSWEECVRNNSEELNKMFDNWAEELFIKKTLSGGMHYNATAVKRVLWAIENGYLKAKPIDDSFIKVKKDWDDKSPEIENELKNRWVSWQEREKITQMLDIKGRGGNKAVAL